MQNLALPPAERSRPEPLPVVGQLLAALSGDCRVLITGTDNFWTAFA